MSASRPRALVVADYPALRAGLREILEREGIAVSAELAVEDLETAGFDPVDVLVADVAEPEALLAAIELPAVLLVDRAGLPARDGGTAARGYLRREASAEAVAAAVRAVAAGMLVVDPQLATAALPLGLPTTEQAPSAPLTEREQEVLSLVAVGLPNKGIALELGISEHTVKFHVGSILGKLDAASRTEAVMAAARRGLLAL